MVHISKYIAATKLTWSSGFMYRLNFVMWRVRMFIQLIAVYFLWATITQRNSTPFGYEQSILITYILGTSFMRAFVFSSRSIDAQSEIAGGDLSNYLVKPINYFGYWFSRDLADKLLNIIFSIVEIIVLVFVFKPPVFIQTNPSQIGWFIIASTMAAIMYFFFSFIISLTTFWYSEANGWPQRFLVFTLLEFFAGGLFPLDILPEKMFELIKLLPPTFFIFTPIQIYLGNISGEKIGQALLTMIIWLVILAIIVQKMWQKGIKNYEAYGR